MFQTLGDVITCVLVLAALLVVPYKLAKVWLAPQLHRLAALFIMSRPAEAATDTADTSALHVPVLGTDTSASTSADEDDIIDDWEMPRVGRRLSDTEIIAVLAAQKGVGGARYRFSANQIYELVKGPRAEVLAQIREVREGPPAPQVREHQARLEQLRSE